MRPRPILTQIERQNAATFTLLPFVAALPRIDIDDETLVRAFGLTMAVRNFTASINYHWSFPDIPDIPVRRPSAATHTGRKACLLAHEAAGISNQAKADSY